MSQLSTEGLEKLKNLLISEEGIRLNTYEDTRGFLSIGVGRNLRVKGISQDEAMYMLNNDILEMTKQLDENLLYRSLDDVRKIVILDMSFNMGVHEMFAFKEMLACLAHQDFKGASDAMLASEWAKQVPNRAQKLAYLMEFGKL